MAFNGNTMAVVLYSRGGKHRWLPFPHLLALLPANSGSKLRTAGSFCPQYSGIPYLYLAENLETSIAEVRPYKGKEISVATVKINERIRISSFNNIAFHGKTLFEQYQLYSLTDKVNMDLSEPVEEETKYFNYIPTQYVAELAKHLQFEGIAYRSSLENGMNYCLFTPKNPTWISSRLFRTKQVFIDHEPVDSDNSSSWDWL